MPTKPWEQMSLDDKLDELRRIIEHFIGTANVNVGKANEAFGEIKERLDSIEKTLKERQTEPKAP
jgi:hypothetical protein